MKFKTFAMTAVLATTVACAGALPSVFNPSSSDEATPVAYAAETSSEDAVAAQDVVAAASEEEARPKRLTRP